MFGDVKSKDDVKLWVGPNAAASLRGSRVRWYCAREGEGSRWSREVELPAKAGASDVAAIHANEHGLALVLKDGRLFVLNGSHGGWDARGNALVDGAA